MKEEIALIRIPESDLVEDIAANLSGSHFLCRILSLDAPLEGKPVTMAGGNVSWEGVDLMQVGAVFIERPVFTWPQTRLPSDPVHIELPLKQWTVYQREADSLTVSALSVVAEAVPMINPPSTVHMAVSPAVALERLAAAGIEVHPWSLGPAPHPGDPSGGLVIDACGRDRWHEPLRPDEGEPSIMIEPVTGEVVTFLIIGDTCSGAARHGKGGEWIVWHGRNGGSGAEEPGTGADDAVGQEILSAPESCGEALDMAKQTIAALGLGFAAVSILVGASRNEVLLVEASPDLAAWNRMLDGRAAAALADHLISIARSSQST